MNDTLIKVADNANLKDSLLATGFPYHNFAEMNAYLDVLTHFMLNTRGLRRMGSAAIDLAYTACGRFDAFFELNLSPWDIAAGILLVTEAGGEVSTFDGKPDVIFGNQILASSKALYPEMAQILKTSFS
jgi:myo-inositol-1(or 4)-monophosphatase